MTDLQFASGGGTEEEDAELKKLQSEVVRWSNKHKRATSQLYR